MKLVKILDPSATALVTDLKTQTMLKELVASEYSVAELARRLNIPLVTLWKRTQKLLAAGLIQVSAVRKSGNLETKMYRATAASFVPAQLLEFSPKDHRLAKALETYSEIQKLALGLQAQGFEIPKESDPVDYFHYAGMRAFVDLHKLPEFHRKVAELGERLSDYERGS